MMRFFGGLLLAVGILIAGGSGICSLAVLFDSGEYGGMEMLSAVAIFGGIPFVIGAGIGVAGWAMLKKAREEDS
jgi:hypothetical protein